MLTSDALDALIETDAAQLPELLAKAKLRVRLLQAMLDGQMNDIAPAPVAKPKPLVRPTAGTASAPSSPTPTPPVGKLADRLGAFLKINGPKRRDALRNALNCTNDQLDDMLEHPWFEMDGGMFTLSSTGHVEFAKGQEP